MQIRVLPAGRDYIASVHDDGVVVFTSRGHPREGCAVREAMIWMLATWGHAKNEVVLELVEWR